MQRYFLNDNITEETFRQSGYTLTRDHEHWHHLVNVMRAALNDRVSFILANQIVIIARITAITPESVHVAWEETKTYNSEMPVHISLAVALLKGEKLELVVQKATELGASTIIPFSASRSVSKWDDKKSQKKRARLQKIAQEASEQSHRTVCPEIDEHQTFRNLLQRCSTFDHVIVAYEETAKAGEHAAFRTVLERLAPAQSLLIITGPEGGFSEEEISQLQAAGAICCSFGPRILRAETAPLYALACLSYTLEL